jgi:hypothetical protein
MGRGKAQKNRPSRLLGADGKPAGPVPFEGLPVREQTRVLALALDYAKRQQIRTTQMMVEVAGILSKKGMLDPEGALQQVVDAMAKRRAEEAEAAKAE